MRSCIQAKLITLKKDKELQACLLAMQVNCVFLSLLCLLMSALDVFCRRSWLETEKTKHGGSLFQFGWAIPGPNAVHYTTNAQTIRLMPFVPIVRFAQVVTL